MSTFPRSTRIVRTRLAIAAVVAALAVTGAACSAESDTVESGSPSGPAASPPVSLAGNVNDHGEQEVTGATAELAMELDDSYFAPTYVQAEPGAVVSLELENEGTKTHTFTLDDGSIDVKVEPGASSKVDVTMPASGSLHFFCQIHSGAGMQGSFVVASGGSASTTAPTTAPASTPTTASDDYRPY